MERIFFSSVLATWFFIFWLDREMVGFWRFHAADDFLGEFFEHFGNISSIFGRSFDIRHAIFTAILFCFFLCYFTFGFFVRLKQRKKKVRSYMKKIERIRKRRKQLLGVFYEIFFIKKKIMLWWIFFFW